MEGGDFYYEPSDRMGRKETTGPLRFVFDSLDRVTKNLLQAHRGRTVGLAEVFVDLIPVIHPWSGKAN